MRGKSISVRDKNAASRLDLGGIVYSDSHTNRAETEASRLRANQSLRFLVRLRRFYLGEPLNVHEWAQVKKGNST